MAVWTKLQLCQKLQVAGEDEFCRREIPGITCPYWLIHTMFSFLTPNVSNRKEPTFLYFKGEIGFAFEPEQSDHLALSYRWQRLSFWLLLSGNHWHTFFSKPLFIKTAYVVNFEAYFHPTRDKMIKTQKGTRNTLLVTFEILASFCSIHPPLSPKETRDRSVSSGNI